MNVHAVRSLKTKLADMISKIPDDIKKKIYKEYFELTIKYERIMKILYLQNRISSVITTKILARYIKKAVNDDDLKNILIQNSRSFSNMYDTYTRKDSTRYFKNFKDEYENLAMIWIWNEFH